MWVLLRHPFSGFSTFQMLLLCVAFHIYVTFEQVRNPENAKISKVDGILWHAFKHTQDKCADEYAR